MEKQPSRVSELGYELIACAEQGWEGTLHEFLKQFSAKTAPSTTWNSMFQGKSAAWCGLLLSSSATCSDCSFGRELRAAPAMLGYPREGLAQEFHTPSSSPAEFSAGKKAWDGTRAAVPQPRRGSTQANSSKAPQAGS